MVTRTTSGKPTARKAKPSAVGAAIKVNPEDNRSPNAAESAPETLVPDVVRTKLVSTPVSEPTVSREARITNRAYELACERGFAPGNELEDWLKAEREIDAQPVRQTPPEDQFTG